MWFWPVISGEHHFRFLFCFCSSHLFSSAVQCSIAHHPHVFLPLPRHLLFSSESSQSINLILPANTKAAEQEITVIFNPNFKLTEREQRRKNSRWRRNAVDTFCNSVSKFNCWTLFYFKASVCVLFILEPDWLQTVMSWNLQVHSGVELRCNVSSEKLSSCSRWK